MTELTVVDLSDAREAVQDSLADEAELADLSLGQIVSVEGEGDGIIAAKITKNTVWPAKMDEQAVDDVEHVKKVTDEGTKLVASEENPLYVVALEDGGSVPASPDEISTDNAAINGDGEQIKSWQEAVEKGSEANLAEIYDRMDHPSSMVELRAAKKELIQQRQAAELADYVEGEDMNVTELQDWSAEELANIPGVDDPEVGFASEPDGWTRKSFLQAWASLGGMWRTCYARMIREMGPNFAKRWCAAMKDEVLGTEEWRNSF